MHLPSSVRFVVMSDHQGDPFCTCCRPVSPKLQPQGGASAHWESGEHRGQVEHLQRGPAACLKTRAGRTSAAETGRPTTVRSATGPSRGQVPCCSQQHAKPKQGFAVSKRPKSRKNTVSSKSQVGTEVVVQDDVHRNKVHFQLRTENLSRSLSRNLYSPIGLWQRSAPRV